MCEFLPVGRQSGLKRVGITTQIHLAHWDDKASFHTKLWKGQRQFRTSAESWNNGVESCISPPAANAFSMETQRLTTSNRIITAAII